MKRTKKHLFALFLCLIMLFSLAGCSSTDDEVTEDLTVIEGLTVNWKTDPIGIETSNIRFGWKMNSNVMGQAASAYQIIVTDSSGREVWDSNVVESDLSTAIAYEGPTPEPETKYTWVVTVTDVSGKTHTSEPATFETGCDWGDTKWISTPNYSNTMNSLLFRTEQKLSNDDIASARLYITGLGAYEAYINGQEVQSEVNSIMAPGWTDYSSYINYQTYDVTGCISKDNEKVTLGAVVGKGWYGSSLVDSKANGYSAVIGQPALLELCLYAKLVITYTDETSQVITTGSDGWKVTDHTPYGANGVYEGEVYNAVTAKTLDGWNTADFNDNDWTEAEELTYHGKILASSDGIIYDYKELPLISAYTYNVDTDIINVGNPYAYGELDSDNIVTYQGEDTINLKAGDILIADFGQNAAGTAAFEVSAPAGTTITFQPGEVVSDGRDGAYTKGALIPGACIDRGLITYIASGEGTESHRVNFNYTGHQYYEIKSDRDVTFYRLSTMAVSSVGDETGFIETSNELLNKFILNSKWSLASNYNSIPTDCPQRELYGWTGDAQLFIESAMYHYDSAAFLRNFNDIMDDYYKTYGVYGNIIPMHTNSFFSKMQGSGWADAGIIIPYIYYQRTGDSSNISTYWDSMCNYVDSQQNRGGLSYSLGDWSGIEGEGATTPFMTQVYYIYINQMMSQLAKALGKNADEVKYTENAESGRQKTIETYVAADGTVDFTNSQTALSWALKLKLYNTEEQYEEIVSNLAASVRNQNQSISSKRGENTLATGFLGVNVLLPALSDGGQSGAAYDLMLSTNLYSFLYSVNHGANTIWEAWDIWTEEKGYQNNTISHNHYSYGAASEWMYENMIGIQRDEAHPGFKHFILQPEPNIALTYAKGSYDSYYGKIISNWQYDGSNFDYECKVPANTTATLYLPATDVAAILVNDVAIDKAEGLELVGETTHNGIAVVELKLVSGLFKFTSTTKVN